MQLLLTKLIIADSTKYTIFTIQFQFIIQYKVHSFSATK